MKNPMILASCLLGALAIIVAAFAFRPQDQACIRLQARMDLAGDFCMGLAESAAKERCAALTEDSETAGRCVQVIIAAAHSNCMNYLNVQGMKMGYESACN